jgi:hypothetical protein
VEPQKEKTEENFLQKKGKKENSGLVGGGGGVGVPYRRWGRRSSSSCTALRV